MGQPTHHTNLETHLKKKLNHAGEALDDRTKELILDAEITEEYKRGQYTLPYQYNSYFGTSIFAILDTSIMARKFGTASSRPLDR